MKKFVLALVGILVSSSVIADTSHEEQSDVVNIYSFRQAFLIEPILQEFTQETGIRTRVVFSKKGLIERLKREGKHTQADLVLTSNFSALLQLQDNQLTQPIQSSKVKANIPAHFRDPEGSWIALTKRVRNIYSSKTRLGPVSDIAYEDLADKTYQGKVCTRSGKHPYNLGLIASMIAHHGEAQTRQWLLGVKANLARKPQGNDRAQVKAANGRKSNKPKLQAIACHLVTETCILIWETLTVDNFEIISQ